MPGGFNNGPQGKPCTRENSECSRTENDSARPRLLAFRVAQLGREEGIAQPENSRHT